MRYSTPDLAGAATEHDGVAGDIEQILTTIGGLTLDAGALGTVTAAAGFATGLERARTGLGQGAGHDNATRRDQGRRTSIAARLSGLLTQDTTDIAASSTPPLATPGSILDQMGP